MIHAALLIAAILPSPAEPVRDVVDVIEVNHYFDEQGRLVFDQIIFIDLDDSIVAWRMLKNGEPQLRRDWRNGGYVMTWKDETNGSSCLREVRSRFTRTTWTQHDPEVAAREKLPKEMRRELRKR